MSASKTAKSELKYCFTFLQGSERTQKKLVLPLRMSSLGSGNRSLSGAIVDFASVKRVIQERSSVRKYSKIEIIEF